MTLPPPPDPLPSLGASLRRADGRTAPRMLATIASGLLLAGLGFAGTWVYLRFWSRSRIDGRFVTAALAFAGAVWLPLQVRIWSDRLRGVRLWPAIVITMVLWSTSVAGCLVIWNSIAFQRTGPLLVAAILLVSGGMTLLVWSPAILQVLARRALLTADGQVDVRCPHCGYSLVGLRELRCPECGTSFAIDELILAQRFERPLAPQAGNAAGRATPSRPRE